MPTFSFLFQKLNQKVKDLTQQSKLLSPTTSNSNSQYVSYTNHQITNNANNNHNILLISIKNLEKDLDILKKLYNEELKQMRFEIEELSTLKNKFSLDNYNLELKLKDFIIK